MSTGKNNGILGSLALLAIVATVHSGPATRITEDGRDLLRFGNLEHNRTAESRLNVNNLYNIQGFADPRVTKSLDNETMESSSVPHKMRCNKRAKRYVLGGSSWTKKDLTYNILKYTDDLNNSLVDDTIKWAFKTWCRYIDLRIRRKTTGKVDIEILFVEGDHDDNYPFHGKGNALAHAFYPSEGGGLHFDDAELWTIGDPNSTDLYAIALHEIGHVLGLSHTTDTAAIMHPFFWESDVMSKLQVDDILGVQDLYGERIKKSSRLQPDDKLCRDPKIDAIFHSRSNQTYIFKGDRYYVLANDSIYVGFHRFISKAWPGLPGNIDAAFTNKNKKTFFFKRNRYWRYSGRKMDTGYPKKIREDFPGIPGNLDAAMTFNNGQETTFYKENSAWDYKSENNITTTSLLKLPFKIDAAIEGAGESKLLFKDDQIYVFRKGGLPLYQMGERLPHPSASTWLVCSNNEVRVNYGI